MIAVEFLQAHSLFGGISEAELQAVIPHFRERSFPAGDFIIREGEHGSELYMLCRGCVEVLKQAEDDAPVRLAVLRTGDTFGEMELIDIQRRSASVRAMTDVDTVSLSNADMYALYHAVPHAYTVILMNIAREISRRLRATDALAASSLCHDRRAGAGGSSEDDLTS